MTCFLLDAQLPARLAKVLRARGFDAIHTSELPEGNATPDGFINVLSVEQQRVVVSKDADFSDSFILRRVPYKLLLVSTGNIRNPQLEALFLSNLELIAELLQKYSFPDRYQKGNGRQPRALPFKAFVRTMLYVQKGRYAI